MVQSSESLYVNCSVKCLNTFQVYSYHSDSVTERNVLLIYIPFLQELNYPASDIVIMFPQYLYIP